jgi:hypothetical protein
MVCGSRPLPLVKTGNNKAKPDPKAKASNIQFSIKKFTGQTFIHQKNATLSAGR